MKSAYLRRAPLSMACMLALQATTLGHAQAVNPPAGTDPAPYEIPLSIQSFPAPTLDPHPANPYWTPVTPANPYPDKTYQWHLLMIGIGLNGGTPVQMKFDTGSTVLNIDAGQNYKNLPWLPLKGATTPAVGRDLLYGDGSYGNQSASMTMPSVEFYKIGDDTGAMTRVTQFAPAKGIPM